MAWFHAMIYDGLSPHFKHSSLFMITHPRPHAARRWVKSIALRRDGNALDAAGGVGPRGGHPGCNHYLRRTPGAPLVPLKTQVRLRAF